MMIRISDNDDEDNDDEDSDDEDNDDEDDDHDEDNWGPAGSVDDVGHPQLSHVGNCLHLHGKHLFKCCSGRQISNII